MIQQALGTQDSIVGLTSALTAASGKAALPEPVLQAAQQILAHQLQLDSGKLNGAAVKQAILNSGLFQEAKLAAGQAPSAATDLKVTLLALQKSLVAWLGPPTQQARLSTLPPPLRGSSPRARSADAPAPDLPDDPIEAGKVLQERTEGALSRLRLHQSASLPDSGQTHDAQWSLDLPVAIAGQHHLLHIQIHRDAENASAEPSDRGWQMRFAIHLGEKGEVGAQIAQRGASTGVMIWADDPHTASLLSGNLADLRQELLAGGLQPGSVLVRNGAPPAAANRATQHILDESR